MSPTTPPVVRSSSTIRCRTAPAEPGPEHRRIRALDQRYERAFDLSRMGPVSPGDGEGLPALPLWAVRLQYQHRHVQESLGDSPYESLFAFGEDVPSPVIQETLVAS